MARERIYRPRAEEDLEAIYKFTAQDSPARAFGFIEQIQRRCDLLRESPEQGRSRPDLSVGVRIIPYGRSVVIVHRLATDAIEILRIFYGGQDYETMMAANRCSSSRSKLLFAECESSMHKSDNDKLRPGRPPVLDFR